YVMPYLSFFITIRPPPSSTLFPYTTLFRSQTHLPDPVSRRRRSFRRESPSSSPFPHRRRCGRLCYQLGCKPSRSWCRCPLLHSRSEEHTSELQSRENLVCRLLLEKKNC